MVQAIRDRRPRPIRVAAAALVALLGAGVLGADVTGASVRAARGDGGTGGHGNLRRAARA